MKPLSNHLDVRALLEFTSRFEHYTAFYNNILIIDKSFLLTDTCFPEYRFPGCEIALKIKSKALRLWALRLEDYDDHFFQIQSYHVFVGA